MELQPGLVPKGPVFWKVPDATHTNQTVIGSPTGKLRGHSPDVDSLLVSRSMDPRVSRRSFLVGAATSAALAGCSAAARTATSPRSTTTTVRHGQTVPTAAAPGGPAIDVANGARGGTRVALTFHGSGDVSLTDELLGEAKRLAAPITIFAVGSWLEANPTVGERILADGYELANHTYSHPALATLGPAAVSEEIQRCAQALRRIEGTNGRWFRPSGIDQPTPLILEEAGSAGYPVSVGYDVDPRDYQDPGPSVVAARVKAAVQPGSIISLHTGHVGTVRALEAMVTDIRARGLRPVLVRDLIAR